MHVSQSSVVLLCSTCEYCMKQLMMVWVQACIICFAGSCHSWLVCLKLDVLPWVIQHEQVQGVARAVSACQLV